MNVIYVNYRPNRSKKHLDEFTDYNILTMLVSSLVMKEKGFTTILMGDPYTAWKMKKLQCEDAWDYIDGSALDQMIDKQYYDIGSFFNIGKFYALTLEKAPCIMMDIDLILWDDFTPYLELPTCFTHWESVLPYTKWYSSKSKLHIPDGYEFCPSWSFRKPAANTSIMYFNNDSFKEHYCKEALRFIRGNYLPSRKVNPEICFVEQQLFTMCLDELSILKEVTPFIDTCWSPLKGHFTRKKPNHEWWHHYLPEKSERVTHTWISKQAIEQNRKFRDYYCVRLLEEVYKLSPALYSALKQKGLFSRYIKLIDRHADVSVMIEKGVISSTLYP